MRSDRVPLSPDEPRCEPPACTMRSRCARALAAIPRGGIVRDYQQSPGAGTATCSGLLLVEVVRKMAAQPQRPAAKPWPTDGGS